MPDRFPGNNDVKVDVTLNEVLSFPLEDRPVLRGYPEFAGLPENRPILVYSLNEIAAEKTLALTDPARNEPRDLYDLWNLTDNEKYTWARSLSRSVKNWNSARNPAKDCRSRSRGKKLACRRCGTRAWPTKWRFFHRSNRFFARCVALSAKPICRRQQLHLFRT